MPRQEQADASEITRDDMVLFPHEILQFFTPDSPSLQISKIRMPANFILQRG